MKVKLIGREYQFQSLFFLFVFFLYPYVGLLDTLFHVSIFNYNGSLIFCEGGVFLIFLASFFSISCRAEWWRMGALVLLLTFFSAMHVDAYHDGGVRYVAGVYQQGLELFIYFFVAMGCVDRSNCNLFKKAIFFNTFVVGLIGIIHFFYFPELVLTVQKSAAILPEVSPFYVANDARESSILGNASVYANFVLFGFILLYYENKKIFSKNIIAVFLFAIKLAFFAVAISLSGSRYPFLVMGVMLIVLLYGRLSIYRVFFGLFVILIFIYAFSEHPDIEVINRFHENLGGRTDKLQLGLDFISHLGTFLYGVDSSVVRSTRLGGVTFSDNSYLQVAQVFGGLMTIIIFGYIFYLVFKYLHAKKLLLIFLYFLLLFSETNAVLWGALNLYFFVLWRAISVGLEP